MMPNWEKPPFYVVALTAAMIGASAGFLAYAVFSVRDAASGIELLRTAHLNSLLVHARIGRPRSDEGQPVIRGGMFVTPENVEDVRRSLAGMEEGVRVRSADFDVRHARAIEAADASLVPFTIELAGPFPAVTAYLNAFDRSPWLLEAEEVRIIQGYDAEGRSVTRATIEGSAYWR